MRAASIHVALVVVAVCVTVAVHVLAARTRVHPQHRSRGGAALQPADEHSERSARFQAVDADVGVGVGVGVGGVKQIFPPPRYPKVQDLTAKTLNAEFEANPLLFACRRAIGLTDELKLTAEDKSQFPAYKFDWATANLPLETALGNQVLTAAAGGESTDSTDTGSVLAQYIPYTYSVQQLRQFGWRGRYPKSKTDSTPVDLSSHADFQALIPHVTTSFRNPKAKYIFTGQQSGCAIVATLHGETLTVYHDPTWSESSFAEPFARQKKLTHTESGALYHDTPEPLAPFADAVVTDHRFAEHDVAWSKDTVPHDKQQTLKWADEWTTARRQKLKEAEDTLIEYEKQQKDGVTAHPSYKKNDPKNDQLLRAALDGQVTFQKRVVREFADEVADLPQTKSYGAPTRTLEKEHYYTQPPYDQPLLGSVYGMRAREFANGDGTRVVATFAFPDYEFEMIRIRKGDDNGFTGMGSAFAYFTEGTDRNPYHTATSKVVTPNAKSHAFTVKETKTKDHNSNGTPTYRCWHVVGQATLQISALLELEYKAAHTAGVDSPKGLLQALNGKTGSALAMGINALAYLKTGKNSATTTALFAPRYVVQQSICLVESVGDGEDKKTITHWEQFTDYFPLDGVFSTALKDELWLEDKPREFKKM